jgi:hypothetical protein
LIARWEAIGTVGVSGGPEDVAASRRRSRQRRPGGRRCVAPAVEALNAVSASDYRMEA